MINKEELTKARIAWGEGIIAISEAYEEQGINKASTTANVILDNLYGFEFGSGRISLIFVIGAVVSQPINKRKIPFKIRFLCIIIIKFRRS